MIVQSKRPIKYHPTLIDVQSEIMNSTFVDQVKNFKKLNWTEFLDKIINPFNEMFQANWCSFLTLATIGASELAEVPNLEFDALAMGIMPDKAALSKVMTFRARSIAELLCSIGSGEDRVSVDDFFPVGDALRRSLEDANAILLLGLFDCALDKTEYRATWSLLLSEIAGQIRSQTSGSSAQLGFSCMLDMPELLRKLGFSCYSSSLVKFLPKSFLPVDSAPAVAAAAGAATGSGLPAGTQPDQYQDFEGFLSLTKIRTSWIPDNADNADLPAVVVWSFMKFLELEMWSATQIRSQDKMSSFKMDTGRFPHLLFCGITMLAGCSVESRNVLSHNPDDCNQLPKRL